ncbi:MAG: xanthine dehydrogenase family protein molybdopterin-binding subunit [Gemmobacter sp.]
MPRREDARLLTGLGRFVADLVPHDALHLEFLRSPYGAGRVALLDLSAAQGMPGVALVLAGDLGLQAQAAVNPLIAGARVVPMEPFAAAGVRAAGQAVAAVVAATAAQALDAVEAVALEVEGAAVEPAPVVTARWGAGGTLPDAAHRVAVRVDHALVAPMPLEPRAVLAVPEGAGLVLYLAVQTPHRARDDLAAMLGVPVRVVAPDVGGAFGGKASLMPEDVVVAVAALRLGRAVVWQGTRGEAFLADTQGRGAGTWAEAAVDADGRVMGLRAGMAFPLGHWMAHSALAPARNGGRILPGPYTIADCGVEVVAEATEGPAVNIYRGAGRPEAAMLMERVMDRAAAAVGIDPLALRRRNVAGAGLRACSGDMAGLLELVAREASYGALRVRLGERRAAGEVCGIGIGLYVEPCGQGWEHAALEILPDGRIRAMTGASAQGQGRETALAQVVAGVLGVSPGRVEVVAGDTGAVAEGVGALASRSTAIGASAMLVAAQALEAQARAVAGGLMGVDPGAVVISDAGLSGGGAMVGWGDLGPVEVALRHEAAAEAWASGAVLAEVGIDRETGVVTVERITWVDDAGVVVNPMLVHGQLMGGLAQGLGAALMERMAYAGGQLLTGSLMDYAVPRAGDMPPVRIISRPVPSPANPLGAKGVGEAGCIGVPAAILNAVQDALIPFDAPDLSLPLTPEKVWRALTRMPQEAA